MGLAGTHPTRAGTQRRGLRRNPHRLSGKVRRAAASLAVERECVGRIPASRAGISTRLPGPPRFPPLAKSSSKITGCTKAASFCTSRASDSITDAEQLAGLVVAVPLSERVPLAEDEVYISDLIGCTLVDVARPDAPVVVGQIEDVERAVGTAPMLIVQSASGEVLIPFAKIYLRKLDLDARRLEMALPEGLTDLNT